MNDIHITRELLRAVSRGELPARALTQMGLDHLMSLCSTCREEIEAWERDERARPEDYERAFQALPAVVAKLAPALEEEKRRAAEDMKRLLALPPAERPARVKRARSRFRGMQLAELLVQESRRRTPADPHEGRHLAELARTVIHNSPGAPGSFELLALASAHLANACRVAGDMLSAEQHFAFVRHVILQHGVTDTQILAWIDHLEGSLRKDQRRFPFAEQLLTRAAMLHRISGDVVETARVLLNLGYLYYFQGKIDPAIETTRVALDNLPINSEPLDYLYARHNLALYLVEAGHFHQAAEILALDESLHSQFPEPWTQLRFSWLRGRIAAGLGDTAEAERAFLDARDGFIRESIGYDAALVSLDLALLYLRGGRTADVRRLAEEMLPIFEAQDLHREALGALVLVQDAARSETLTSALVLKTAAALKAWKIRRKDDGSM